jgi:4-hydroxy-tetrahydrodipicolinate synthase
VYHKDTSKEHDQVAAKLDIVKEINDPSFEFYDAHSPNASFSVRHGAKGMSSISGNFYPEALVWLCNNAADPAMKEKVDWLQSEITRVDPMIHDAYPMSAKYFLAKRGLPVRTISRAHALELTPEQKQTLDAVHASFLNWCDELGIERVDIAEIVKPKVLLDSPI